MESIKKSNVKFGAVDVTDKDYKLIIENYVPEKFDLEYP